MVGERSVVAAVAVAEQGGVGGLLVVAAAMDHRVVGRAWMERVVDEQTNSVQPIGNIGTSSLQLLMVGVTTKRQQ